MVRSLFRVAGLLGLVLALMLTLSPASADASRSRDRSVDTPQVEASPDASVQAPRATRTPRGNTSQTGVIYSQSTITVGNEVFTVGVTVPAVVAAAATGPIQVAVSVPARISSSIITCDNGFGHGYAYSFHRGGRSGQVTVSVIVPSAVAGAIEVAVSAASGYAVAVPGQANAPVVVQTFV